MVSQNRFCILLACFALAGCGEITSSQISPGVTEIRYTEANVPGGDGPGWAKVAMQVLTEQAVKQCPQGYTKLNERVITGERNITVWRITCD